MTIIRPNSISGINSITAKNTDQMKLYDSNGSWSHVRAGVITATKFVGPFDGTTVSGSTGAFSGDVTISGDLGVAGTLTYEDVARVDALGISTYREGLHIGPLAGIGATVYKDGSIRTTGIITATNLKVGPSNSTRPISIYSASDAHIQFQGSGTGTSNGNADGFIVGNGGTNDATLWNYENGYIRFGANNAERLRILSDGKLILGATSASNAENFRIHTGSSDKVIMKFTNTTTGTAAGDGFEFGLGSDEVVEFWNKENTDIKVATNNTERARITSDGNVLIGTTNTTTAGTVNKNLVVGSTTNNDEVALTLNVMEGTNNRRVKFFLDDDDGVFGVDSTASTGVAPFVIRNAGTERLRISDGKFVFRYDNGGGMGPYISLQNRGSSAAGTKTGIAFGCDTSDAVLGGSDYANGEIEVRNEGSNNGGIMEFRVHHGSGNFPAIKIHGNGANVQSTNSNSNAFKGGVAFGCAGVAIDKSWDNYPGMNVLHTTAHSDTNQGQFRFHGWNRNFTDYPAATGSDFSVTVVADGMTITSDQRRKTGITTITDALDTVSKLRGVSFTMLNRDLTPQTHMSMADGKKLGFIAQEVIPILPSAVMDSGDHVQPLENGYCDRYMMDYGAITPVLVEAIKELKNENAALRARVSALES